MTPFPEAEIMTIKRLEVALRKMDYKLLKDGAYKLHEKFHGGYKFEYLNLLEEILLEVSENPQVPSDIKDILCPTIEDILLQSDYSVKSETDIALEQAKERVFEDNKNLEIALKNSINMIKAMNMKIVVEGIETEELVKYFSELQCEYIQGYFFSKPIPKDEFVRFITKSVGET